MNQGLASLPTRRFDGGGVIGGPFAPAISIGPVGISPMDMMAIAVPAIAPAVTAVNAINALSSMNATMGQQAPAPVSTHAESQIAQAIAAENVDAQDAAEGLTAMNAVNAQAAEADDAAVADAAATATMADAVADSIADANAADAAAAAAGDGGAAAGDGGGGDGGAAAGDGAAAAGDGGSSGDGSGGEKAGGIITMRDRYAQGGMPDVARHVQSQGRGDDRVLVHMTPREVQGLQYLAMRHGGSLTVNPRTGLVEAGFLSNILPMIAGAALTAASGGTLAPWAAGLMVGGGYGLATGSLKKGLMAGLGAFGGAGLGAGLGAAGAASEAAVTSPQITGSTFGLDQVGQSAAFSPPPSAAINNVQYTAIPTELGGSYVSPNVPGTGASYFLPETGSAQLINAPAAPTFGGQVSQMGGGIKNILDFENAAGTQARQAFMQNVGGYSGLASKVGSAAAPVMGNMTGPDQSKGGPSTQEYIRPFKYEAGKQDVPYRTGARGESTAEQLYFSPRYTPLGVFKPEEAPAYGSYAKGGGVREPIDRSQLDEDLYDFADFRKKRAMQEAGLRVLAEGGDVGFDDDLNMNVGGLSAYSDDFYGGGLTALAAGGKPNDPRFLVGKGDGMSDSIPATINDTQPARLADGEFVIPADVVSHLGNGSSKAGAAKLHSMMSRIRKVRTGKNKQAPEVKAERYMPA